MVLRNSTIGRFLLDVARKVVPFFRTSVAARTLNSANFMLLLLYILRVGTSWFI